MRSTGLRTFARTVIAHALATRETGGMEGFVTRRWGPNTGVAMMTKAGVGAITSGDPMSAIGAQDDEFFASVAEASLIGRMNPRTVPFLVRMLRSTTAARGYWVGQSKPIPVSKPALAGSSLERRKIAAIILATKESLEAANPAAEARFEEELRVALVGALDEAFIDAGNAGVADEQPAAVTNGVAATASTGDPAQDIAALIDGFAGNLQTAVFVTDPLTAAEIALARDGGGSFAFPDCGPRGGSLIGVPLLTSQGSPRDSTGGQLALIDPAGIAANVEGIEIAKATQAALEAADDPTGATDTPAAMTKTLVSLFQTDTIAFKATIYANWEDQRGGVALVTGADYSAVS